MEHLKAMAGVARSSLWKSFPIPGLFQIALIGTGFAALRLLQGPSTVTIFIFELTLATTLGFFLYGRLVSRSKSPLTASEIPGREGPSLVSLTRLRRLAARLGVPTAGSVEELQASIKSELRRVHDGMPIEKTDRDFPRLALNRIAPPPTTQDGPSVMGDAKTYIGILAEEGRALVSMAHDLEFPVEPYKQVLRSAQRAAALGRTDKAIQVLEEGNARLRTRLGAIIARDLESLERVSRRHYLALSTIFFVLIGTSLWILSEDLHVASLTFYVLVAGAGGTVALNVQLSGNRRSVGVLLQIMVLAVLLKFYFFYLNPYLYTSDTYFHSLIIAGIDRTGHVPGNLDHYSYFPGYHVFAFAGIAVTGLPLTWYGIFAFLAELVAVPVTYLIGREIADRRVGLFAAIFTLFSVFFLLPVIPLPSLFGLCFTFLALYALVKVSGPRWRPWFAVFWISALGAFFSHAITALVLLLALLLRFIYFSVMERKAGGPRPFTPPFLSYGVVYGGYMALIALVSFELFLVTIFAPTSAPALATAPEETLQTTPSYVLQTALAPLSIAIMFFFAAFGMLSSHGISTPERRFLVLLASAFVLIPALEVVTENFRAQSTRFLTYLTVPFVVLAAHGTASAVRRIRSRRSAVKAVVPTFLVFAFIGASTYLANNDIRTLYDVVPVIPTHITESAVSSRDFLSLAGEDSLVYMDFGSWLYFNENELRARYALELQTETLDRFNGSVGSFVVVNAHFIPYGNPYLGIMYESSRTQALLESVQASRLFDAGEVQVYLVP